MRTLRDLALIHMHHNGMDRGEATAALDRFASTSGRDVEWGKQATFLPAGLARRIDTAAVNWLMVPQEPVVEPEVRMLRDGKMLATGEV